MFNGGEASLSLEDDWQSGVKLMARPPGKRNSSLALLSGGEKALTALALVFAIFRLNPAPFCVLDEVDAPLDDANVQSDLKMVLSNEEMKEKSNKYIFDILQIFQAFFRFLDLIAIC